MILVFHLGVFVPSLLDISNNLVTPVRIKFMLLSVLFFHQTLQLQLVRAEESYIVVHSQNVPLHVAVLAESFAAFVAAIGLRSSVHSEVVSERTRLRENVAASFEYALEEMGLPHGFYISFCYDSVPGVWNSFKMFCELLCVVVRLQCLFRFKGFC